MVKIGVIGCGYWGPKHIRNFHELEEAKLKAVCDLDEERLGHVKTQYPYVKTITNCEELLRDNVDGVVIATPVNTHYQLARQALLHDKHVLIEKPVPTKAVWSSLGPSTLGLIYSIPSVFYLTFRFFTTAVLFLPLALLPCLIDSHPMPSPHTTQPFF